MKILILLFLSLTFTAQGSYEDNFSIEKEFGARRLSSIFEKKHDMNVKIKRKDGDLIFSVGDQGFFSNKGRITASGASFVRKLTHYLCKESSDCKIELKNHHFENGYVTRNEILKKSQYKLTAVALQVFKANIKPHNVLQIAAGDSEPLKDLDKNDYAESGRLTDYNTRFELKFTIQGDKI